MSSQIKIIPIERPFLKDLARYVTDKFRDGLPDLSSLLVVFPSQRNKFYFRRYLIEASQRPALLPPAMKTIDELFNELAEFKGGLPGARLHPIERSFLLKQVIDELRVEFWRDLPFLKFISIADRLLNFFDELAEYRLTLEEIAAQKEREHFPERFVVNELEIYRTVFDRYRRKLKEIGAQDEIDRSDLLDQPFDPECLAQYRFVILAGLAAMTRIASRLVGSLLARVPSELILHTGRPSALAGPPDLKNPFYPHQKIIQFLGVKEDGLEIISADSAPDHPVIHLRGLPTETQQSLYLSEVLRQAVLRYPPHRIAVVLVDEEMAHTVTEALAGLNLEHNLSLGQPCHRSLPYTLLTALAQSLRSRHHFPDFFRLINHPLIKTSQGPLAVPLRSLVYQLQSFMVDHRQNYFRREEVPADPFAPLLDVLARLISAVTQELPLTDYLTGLAEMLNSLLTGNEPLVNRNRTEIGEFFDRLDELSALRLPQGVPEPGLPTLDFVLAALEHATFRHLGDPMRGIQVIGHLEARNLDFDCLIIPQLNEGVFPPTSDKDLFLNHDLRQRLGLPYDKERENLSRYYFTEFISGKREVHLIYLTTDRQDVRSRLVELLIHDQNLTADESPLTLARAAVPAPVRRAAKTPEALNQFAEKIRREGLSPSALKDYKLCPYRFYLKYICGLREPDVLIEMPDARIWGIALHRALERFYREEYPHGFTERDLERAKLILNVGLENALKEVLAQQIRGEVYLELPLYQRRLEKFLEYELTRFQAGFQVDARQQEKWINHHITVAGRRIRLKGSIDRVDRRDGQQYVIDYKSGRKPRAKHYLIGDDFVEFQLPFYALCLTEGRYEQLAGLAFYAIGPEIELLDLGRETDLITYLHDFEEQELKPTIADILDPEKPFAPAPNQDACRYCAFSELCGER